MTRQEPRDLVSIELPRQPQGPRRFVTQLMLRAYRLAIVAAIAYLVRDQYVWQRVQGERPVELSEIVEYLPTAARLRVDHSIDAGMFVHDANGLSIGYAVKTSPTSDKILGYCGPTDSLIVLDENRTVAGISIRDSADTIRHVDDVKTDRYFLPRFLGRSWEELAELDLEAEGIEGVSGATLTSLSVAEGIAYRLADPKKRTTTGQSIQWRWIDAGTLIAVVIAMLLAFTRLRGNRWIRLVAGIGMFAFLGLIAGQLISLSFLFGWAASGIPWRSQIGMVLLVVIAVCVPWLWRRPIYCAQICPHGLAQHFVGRIWRRKIRVPRSLDRGLRWCGPTLVLLALIVTLMILPIDLSDLEPFEAYVSGVTALIPAILAVVGLIASLFIYQPYCKYGCPTGAILSFVRSHGRADRVQRTDVIGGLLLLTTIGLYWGYPILNHWFIGR